LKALLTFVGAAVVDVQETGVWEVSVDIVGAASADLDIVQGTNLFATFGSAALSVFNVCAA